MKRNIRRGFTLAEVLVTVTITAVLAAVVVPSVVNQVKKGDAPSFTSEIQAIGTAVGQFATDNRSLPKALGDLVSSPADSSVEFTWKGPYLSTGQDLSTASRQYTAAAYGLAYADTLANASHCTPDNFAVLAVTKINGTDITGLKSTDPTFTQLYNDLNGTTGPAPTSSAKGPLQYADATSNFADLYVCMIAAKVN